jgi:Lon protease-like protein
VASDVVGKHRFEDAMAAMPLFPLPGTVFFPHTLLPLHVFEPRYRQMTEAVLATHQHMAVVLIDDAGPSCAPGCAAVAGIGRVVHHERLPDGRFHILLQGVGRAQLLEELAPAGLMYRRCRASLLRHDDVDQSQAQRELTTLRACYGRLLDVQAECRETLGDLPLRLDDAVIVADIVNAAVLEDSAARQQALAEPSLVKRLHMANDALASLLLRCSSSDDDIVH